MPSYAQLVEQAEHMGLVIIEQSLPADMGRYDAASGIIYLHDRLNNAQRKCTLMHELIHAEHHRDGLMLLPKAKEERMTRNETARRLVSAAEYAAAERTYDGCAWHIANELGITIGVLSDYQMMLHDGK